nr:MAG TPA: TRAF TRAF-type zinc finger [Caudoviricetes sp.]
MINNMLLTRQHSCPYGCKENWKRSSLYHKSDY